MEKKNLFTRLRSKIMTSTVITIAVSYVIIISVIFVAMFNVIQENVKTEQLLMAQKYAGVFEKKLNNALNYLSIVASTLESQAGTYSADREKLQKIVFNVFENYELIDGSSVYFEPNKYDGKDAEYIGSEYGTAGSGRICYYFYFDNGETEYLPEALENEIEFELAHYTDAKDSNSIIYTSPVVHNVDGRDIHMFTITYPVRDKYNEFIGAVTVDLFLDDIYSQMQSEKIYETGYIVIASDNDFVVYSPNYADIGKSWQEASINYALPSKDEKVAYSNAFSAINKKNSFVTTLAVNVPSLDSDFYLSVSAPTVEIYNDMFKLMTVLSLFSFGMVLIILFILRRKIVKPIKEITMSAHKIADGNLEEVVEFSGISENTETNNEIHILSIALKKMLSQINQIQDIKFESLEMKHEKEKAEESSRIKSVFLANMSHEIRTPMNAIIGMCELILRENISPVVHEHALNIKNAGANLLSIINGILDFSKIESGKLEIIPTHYLFASLINDVLSIIRMRITEKPILFVTNIDSNIPNKLIGDEVRIRQVLLNLLGNAVKYTNEGFISITIDGEIEDGTVLLTFEISDSGIGIKEEDVKKLFNDFVQVDTVKNKSVEGTGLGLAIAKNICRLMGGDITVYSEYGKGSTFNVTIPQKYDTYEKFANVENAGEKKVLIYEPRSIYANSIVCTIDNLGASCTLVNNQSKLYEELKAYPYPFIFVSSFLFDSVKQIVESIGLLSKIILMSEYGEVVTYSNVRTIAMPVHSISVANILNDIADDVTFNQIKETYTLFTAPDARILIVDDINTNLKVAEGLMLPYKMVIDTCKSGAEAIALVQANKYDIIFMDHMMPEMDGIEATNIIRRLDGENEYYKNIPIVALTANAISGVKEMFLQNEMNDFLAKPIDTSKLNAILEKWIPREKQKKYSKEATEAPAATFEYEIMGVDVKAGIAMTGGTIEHYMKTLAIFYKDGTDKIKEIRDCLNKNDIPLYTTVVHALKSASATIGANEISKLAYKLETAGHSNDSAFINENTEEFLWKFDILLTNINIVLAKESESHSKSEPTTINMQLLESELKNLKQALDDVDIGEINAILSRLETNNWNNEIDESISKIKQNIIMFEYDESIILINELLSA